MLERTSNDCSLGAWVAPKGLMLNFPSKVCLTYLCVCVGRAYVKGGQVNTIGISS